MNKGLLGGFNQRKKCFCLFLFFKPTALIKFSSERSKIRNPTMKGHVLFTKAFVKPKCKLGLNRYGYV